MSRHDGLLVLMIWALAWSYPLALRFRNANSSTSVTYTLVVMPMLLSHLLMWMLLVMVGTFD